jgi:ferric-dicitrate binding protein FerR (iron transport regulator)
MEEDGSGVMKQAQWKQGVRVLTGEATPEEREQWLALLARSPEVREEFQRLEGVWSDLYWPVASPIRREPAPIVAVLAPSSRGALSGLLRPAFAALLLGLGIFGGWSLERRMAEVQEDWTAWNDASDSMAWAYLEEASGEDQALTTGEEPYR